MVTTWPAEIEKWEEFKELSFTIVHGAHKAYNLGLPRDIYLINPEGLEWLFTSEIGRQRLQHVDLLVIDESTTFKNSQTKRFKLLKEWLPGFKRRWILTGSFHPNGLEDLFGQVYTLDLGRSLGRFITHFRREFFHLGSVNLYDWQPNEDAYEKVTERVSPLVLQLSAEDYLTMPTLMSIIREVTLPSKVRQLYSELEENFITADESIVGGTRAVVSGKLRQVANGAIYEEDGTYRVLHDEKLGALESLLGEISSPVIILYEFNHDRERILSRFPDMPVLGAGVTPKRMAELTSRFNAGHIPRILGHPGSMALGGNLQDACHHVIWFGITWNLLFYDQAIARVYRQGQQSTTVFVYHIVAKDTKDEEVMKALDGKDRTQQGLLRALSKHRQDNYGED